MKLNYKDFNKLTEKELCALSGVGKTTAKRITGMRPFRTNDDLFKVRGLGKKTLNGVGIEKTKKSRVNNRRFPRVVFTEDANNAVGFAKLYLVVLAIIE